MNFSNNIILLAKKYLLMLKKAIFIDIHFVSTKNGPLKLFGAPSEKIQKLFPSGEGVGYIFSVLSLIFIYPPSLGECKKCN